MTFRIISVLSKLGKTMDDDKLILDAANRYGFNLEFRTKKILEEKNFSVVM